MPAPRRSPPFFPKRPLLWGGYKKIKMFVNSPLTFTDIQDIIIKR